MLIFVQNSILRVFYDPRVDFCLQGRMRPAGDLSRWVVILHVPFRALALLFGWEERPVKSCWVIRKGSGLRIQLIILESVQKVGRQINALVNALIR